VNCRDSCCCCCCCCCWATYSVPPRYSAAGTQQQQQQQQRHPANKNQSAAKTRFIQVCPEPVLPNSTVEFLKRRKWLRSKGRQGMFRRACSFYAPPLRHPLPPPSVLGRENPFNDSQTAAIVNHNVPQDKKPFRKNALLIVSHQLLRRIAACHAAINSPRRPAQQVPPPPSPLALLVECSAAGPQYLEAAAM
jgi:hypothetical protein